MNSAAFPLLIVIIFCIVCAGCSTADETLSSPTIQPTAMPAATTIETPSQASPSPPPQPAEWNPDGIISDGEYLNSMAVGNGLMDLFWSSETGILYMALHSQYDGWVAVGFRPGSVMEDADIILGGFEEGESYIYDMYATGRYGPHPRDADLGGSFNIIAFQSVQADTGTTLEFARPMITGDKYDAVLTAGETIPIIWAVSDNDEPLIKHNKGKGRVDFTP